MSHFPKGDSQWLVQIRSDRQIVLDDTRETRKPSSSAQIARTQAKATQRSNVIFSSWKTLQDILVRHEQIIQNRWKKKTMKKRLAILRETYPGLPSRHRPDIEVMRKHYLHLPVDSKKERMAYLRPYINEEDLSGDRAMLLFLHSRGRNQPRMFSQADFHYAEIGIENSAIVAVHLDGYVMCLGGETAGTYGRCISESDNLSNNPFVFRSGDGLLVLEIQEGVYQFLLRWCYSILHDLASETLTADIYPIETQVPYVPVDSESLTIDTMSKDSPYRLPSAIDFNRLMVVSSAKRADAADHIFALRDNPAYFRNTVEQWSEHRSENILDSTGHPHPDLGSTLFWNRVIHQVILCAYWGLGTWTEIDEKVTEVAQLHKTYSAVIDSDQLLPPQYSKALLQLMVLLEARTNGPFNNLKHGVRASPNLRSNWVSESLAILNKDIRHSYSDPLLWIFGTMFEDFYPHLNLPDLMDELERLTQHDEAQNNRLSAWVAGYLNEAGLIVKLRRELITYWPWTYSIQKLDYIKYEKELKEGSQGFKAWYSIMEEVCWNLSCADLGTPSPELFRYPSHMPRTKKVIETMQKSEKNLDAFWASVDRQFKDMVGQTLDQITCYLFRDYKSNRERTLDWVEIPKKETQTPALEKLDTTEFAEFRAPLASQNTNQLIKKMDSAFITKDKVKTRGTTRTVVVQMDPEELALPALQLAPALVLKVTTRAYRVFRTLFFVPDLHSQPGEIAWSEFLYAMKHIGFRPEKCDGSAWHFIPESLNVKQSIHFHEPHPKAKIRYIVAREWSIRLTRRYGWTGATFELK